MRFSFETSVVAAFVLALSCLNVPANELETPHVSVSGTATTSAKPELMVWRLSIQNKGERLEEVAEEHQLLSANVLKLIKSFDVEEKSIQSEQMRFGENWDYNQGSRKLAGYVASSQISFKSEDLDKYDSVWRSLSKHPEVQVGNVSFDLLPETRILLQNETRRHALLAARNKAEDMATTLHARIGHPLALEDISSATDSFQPLENSRGFKAMAMDIAPGPDDSISTGEIQIRMQVRAVFELMSSPVR